MEEYKNIVVIDITKHLYAIIIAIIAILVFCVFNTFYIMWSRPIRSIPDTSKYIRRVERQLFKLDMISTYWDGRTDQFVIDKFNIIEELKNRPIKKYKRTRIIYGVGGVK